MLLRTTPIRYVVVLLSVCGALAHGAGRASANTVERCQAAGWLSTNGVGTADAFTNWADAEAICVEAHTAKPDDPIVLATLGRIYYKTERFPESLVFMRRSSSAGHAFGAFGMGVLYENGYGVEPDPAEATRWYRQAAEQGSPSAPYNLGVRAWDSEEKLRWFGVAAAQGYAPAQNELGIIYNRGDGVDRNDVEAVRWFRRAAEQGDAFAQANLGEMYDLGEGVDEDDAEAVRWFTLAAEKEHAGAQVALATMYAQGSGVPGDSDRAAGWWRRALTSDDSDARQAAIRSLALWFEEAAIPLLIEALEDPDEGVRRLVVAALMGRGDHRAFAPLLEIIDANVGTALMGAALFRTAAPDDASLLIEKLNDPAPRVRARAALALARFDDSRSESVLLDMLSSEADERVIERVIDALEYRRHPQLIEQLIPMVELDRARDAIVDSGDPRAIPALIGLLRDQAARVRDRAGAAEGLGRFGDSRAVEPLIHALSHDDLVDAAALSLGSLGDVRALGPLLARLNDEEWGEPRDSVIRAVLLIDDSEGIARLERELRRYDNFEFSPDAYWGDESLFKFGRPGSLAELSSGEGSRSEALEKLESDDRLDRWSAAMELRFTFDPQAQELLLRSLEDSDPSNRQVAAEALETQGDERAVEPLIRLLKDPDSLVRHQAVEVLVALGDGRAVEPLLDLLADDDSSWVVESALEYLADAGAVKALTDSLGRPDPVAQLTLVRALGRAGEAQSVPSLLGLLPTSEGKTRRAIMQALGEIGDPRSIAPLIAELGTTDEDARWAAADALGMIGATEAVGPLVSRLRDSTPSVRAAAASALGEIGANDAVPGLLERLDDPESEVRAAAAGALGSFRTPAGRVALEKLLEDPVDRVRIAAVEALGEIGLAESKRKLIQALRDSNAWVRRGAVQAVAGIGDLSSVPALIALLEDSDRWVREAAAEGLARLGDTRAEAPLLALLRDDPEPAVRKAAAAALRQVSGDGADYSTLIEAVENADDFQREVAVALFSAQDSTLLRQLDFEGETPDRAFTILSAFEESGGDWAIQPALDLLSQNRLRSLMARRIDDIYRTSERFPEKSPLGRGKAEFFLKRVLFRAGYLDPRVRAELGLSEWSQDATDAIPYIAAYRTGLLELVSHGAEVGFDNRMELLGLLWSWAGQRASARTDDLAEDIGRVEQRARGTLGTAYALLYGARIHNENRRPAEALRWVDRCRALAPDYPAFRVWLEWIAIEASLRLNDIDEARAGLARLKTELVPSLTLGERVGARLPFSSYSLILEGAVLRAAGNHAEAIDVLDAAIANLRIEKRRNWIHYELEDQLRVTLDSYRVGAKEGLGIQLLEESAREAKAVRRMWQEQPAVSAFQQDAELTLLESALRSNLALAGAGNKPAAQAAQIYAEQLALSRQTLPAGVTPASKEHRKVFDELATRKQVVAILDAEIAQSEFSYALTARNDVDRNDLGGSRSLEDLKKRRSAAKTELKRYFVALKRDHPEVSAFVASEPVELSRLQAYLAPDERLVQYLLLEDQGWAFVVSDLDVDVVELGAGRRALAPLVNRYRSLLQRPGKRGFGDEANHSTAIGEDPVQERQSVARRLAEYLLLPLSSYVSEASSLLLIPSGPLHALPFAALPWRDGYAVESFKLSTLSAASLLAAVSERPESGAAALVVGNPTPFEVGWSPLPGAEAEAIAVAGYFPGTKPFLGSAARRGLLLEEDLSGRVVHLALHAEASSLERTRLVLSDGFVSVSEVWGLALQDSPLVVLSACETAMGEELSGDEVVSLANGFLFAGSRAVLSTLWRVDDAATRDLMERFYAERSRGNSAALAAVQREMLRSYPPHYWAPFVLSGR